MITSGQVLDFDRGRPFDPQHQRGGSRISPSGIANPLHPDRFRMVGDLGTDDIVPMGDDLARGKALALENAGDATADKVGQRFGVGWLVHRARVCHIDAAMTIAGSSARTRSTVPARATESPGKSRSLALAGDADACGRPRHDADTGMAGPARRPSGLV